MVSDFARAEALDRLRVDPTKVVTVGNGVDSPPVQATTSGDPQRPYVLYVGGHEPRKNIAGVLSAMRRYWQRFGFGIDLRLTGTLGKLDRAAARTLNEMPGEAPIVFLGDPDDDELGRQYRGATALILLSKAEGFGLPALEAMAHGCPVIAARRASLPEVVGDAGVLVDPDDADAVADALRRLTASSEHRGQLVTRGLQRARHASWGSVAERYAELYLKVHAESAVGRTWIRHAPLPAPAELRAG